MSVERVNILASKIVRDLANTYHNETAPMMQMAVTIVAGAGASMASFDDPALRIMLLQAYLSSAGFSESQIKRVTQTLGDA